MPKPAPTVKTTVCTTAPLVRSTARSMPTVPTATIRGALDVRQRRSGLRLVDEPHTNDWRLDDTSFNFTATSRNSDYDIQEPFNSRREMVQP
ncbi:hypothetical protein CaCOL14_007938 [Colletotrichum acutatum]